MNAEQEAWARKAGGGEKGSSRNRYLIMEFGLSVKKRITKFSLCLLEGAHTVTVHFCWLSNGKI